MMRTLNAVRLISKLPRAALAPGLRTAIEEASREPVAHSDAHAGQTVVIVAGSPSHATHRMAGSVPVNLARH